MVVPIPPETGSERARLLRAAIEHMRLAGLCVIALPSALSAQGAGAVHVSVRVADSSNAPVSGADVSVVHGLASTLAHGLTNGDGRVTLSVVRADSNVQLVVRKIGYDRAYRFFTLAAADSMALDVPLVRVAQALEAVKVTAAEDLRRKSYYLDAEDIEKSSRPIIDGSDLFKLRPDMMTSRGGAQACEVPRTDRTGWIESVWVNGVRVVLPSVDSDYVAARKPSLGIPPPLPPRPDPRIVALPSIPKARPSPWTQFSHIDSVLSILRWIKPEHIAEVTYHDCFDQSVGKNHSDMAMFIVLKPGIGFKDGVGTYVVAADTTRRERRLATDSLPRYRFRLLGVYDMMTGDPLNDADVIDVATGTRARTTATGTVSLFFVPDGANALRLHRAGFRDTTITVTISPADTVPLTMVMRRAP